VFLLVRSQWIWPNRSLGTSLALDYGTRRRRNKRKNSQEFSVARGQATVCIESLARQSSGPRGSDGGRAIRFDDWEQELRDFDILVSSTAAPHAVVTKAKIEPILCRRRARPLFMIDLAIPRDVEPTVCQLDNVYVYDLDSLRAIADRTLETRKKEMDTCDSLIKQHVCDFEGWLSRASVRVNAPSNPRRSTTLPWTVPAPPVYGAPPFALDGFPGVHPIR
jgi:hypothetical protein